MGLGVYLGGLEGVALFVGRNFWWKFFGKKRDTYPSLGVY